MPTIQINVTGVNAQSTVIGAIASEAVQSTAGYLSQSGRYQDELDGQARASAEELTHSAERAVSASLETERKLRDFMQNASEAVDTVDQRQSGSFSLASGL